MRFSCKHVVMLAILATLALAGLAAASGKIPYDRVRTPVQNLKTIAVEVAKSRCDSVTKTKGTFRSYSTAGYIGIEIDAVDSTGTPVKGRWYLDGRQVGVGSSPFAVTNASGSAFSTARFDGYSAPSRTVEFCIRRQ